MSQLIVTVLTPAIVWIASQLLVLAKKSIPDALMTSLIVPTLSAVAAWVSSIVVPDGAPFAVNVLLGLLSVFLHEFVKNNVRAALALIKGESVPRMGGDTNG